MWRHVVNRWRRVSVKDRNIISVVTVGMLNCVCSPTEPLYAFQLKKHVIPVALEPVATLREGLGLACASQALFDMHTVEELPRSLVTIIRHLRGQYCLAQIHILCFNVCTIRYRECMYFFLDWLILLFCVTGSDSHALVRCWWMAIPLTNCPITLATLIRYLRGQ